MQNVRKTPDKVGQNKGGKCVEKKLSFRSDVFDEEPLISRTDGRDIFWWYLPIDN